MIGRRLWRRYGASTKPKKILGRLAASYLHGITNLLHSDVAAGTGY